MPEPEELGRLIDHAYVAGLWHLGRPPRGGYLVFRRRVAEAVLRRLRARLR